MLTALRHTLAQLGWIDTAWYVLARALQRLSGGAWRLYRYHFIAQHVGDEPMTPMRGADIDIRRSAPHEPPPPGHPRPASVIRARHAQGALELTAWRGGRLAGCIWLIAGAYQEDEVRARYRMATARTGWDFDIWVHPEERLGWVFRRLWEAARRHLREQDVRWTCSRISAFNPGSLRAHARIGTVRLGAALFLRCGGWQWMVASLRPYIHLSRNPASFPQLTFDTTALGDSAPQEQPCPTFNKSAES